LVNVLRCVDLLSFLDPVSWVLWVTSILSFSSNLQEFGGVCFGTIKGMFFSFLCTTQESKKISKFGNWANTCSSRCIEK
jgi:hypothetical protein